MKPKHYTIPMTPPAKKSSQVVAMGHDQATNTLSIQYGSGTYHYHDVSAAKFAELQKAESIGAHMGKHIKPLHKFTKIDPQ